MQITINDQEIDYTLENEKNLFDVLASLRSWLAQEGYVLTAADLENESIDSLTDEELRGRPISTVESLHVHAQSALQKEYQDLAAVGEFFRVVREGIIAGRTDVVRDILREYPYVRDGLDALLARNGIVVTGVNASTLDERMRASGLLENGTMTEGEREQLFDFFNTLTESVNERMAELKNPSESLVSAADKMRDSVNQLAEVSVMLQTGRDAEAMQAIVTFTEISSKIIRLYPVLKQTGKVDYASLVVDGVSFPDFYAEFNGILAELIDAFSGEDSVLIGDLLEYEVSPRLSTLRSYIDLLTKG